jgi:hypothetical protein
MTNRTSTGSTRKEKTSKGQTFKRGKLLDLYFSFCYQ